MQPLSAQVELVTTDEVMDDDMVDEVCGGVVVRLAGYIMEETEEDEEEKLSLVRRERRSKARSDTSSLAA